MLTTLSAMLVVLAVRANDDYAYEYYSAYYGYYADPPTAYPPTNPFLVS